MKTIIRKAGLFAGVVLLAFAAFARTVELKTDKALCRVDLDGARVLSLRVNGSELLWNDTPPQTTAPDWAHGGIPLCWPNFGMEKSGRIHGSAWRKAFELKKWSESPSRSEMVLALKEGDVQLEYVIVLTDALTLEMKTHNAGTATTPFSCGFHPYFLVGERDRCRVDGTNGLSFEDDPSVLNPAKGVSSGRIELTSAIDRIFAFPTRSARAFTLFDRARSRVIRVGCEGATHMNVWNPGAGKRCPGKIPGDEWRRFACVEPIMIGGASSTAFPLAPGARRSLKMTVSVEDAK